MKYLNNIIHAMYCQAVADAVGDPFEFVEKPLVENILKYAETSTKLEVTDDSQMMLHGMMAAYYLPINDQEIKVDFTNHYLDWYDTQTTKFEDYRNNFEKRSLLDFESMYKVKSPGNTCMHSMYLLQNDKNVNNDSKGCGSVMRLLPALTFVSEFGWGRAIEIAKITGDITHQHPENAFAIEVYMYFCKAILEGNPITVFENVKHIWEIGEGWTAQECVQMAYWAYCNSSTFEELLELSIVHDGDSDSVAAVAGTFWGLGMHHLPREYVNKLDTLDAIEFVVSKLNTLDNNV